MATKYNILYHDVHYYINDLVILKKIRSENQKCYIIITVIIFRFLHYFPVTRKNVNGNMFDDNTFPRNSKHLYMYNNRTGLVC